MTDYTKWFQGWTTSQIEERMRNLNSLLLKCSKVYYSECKEQNLVRDSVYDALLRELEFLEAKYPQFKSEDSRSSHVGF